MLGMLLDYQDDGQLSLYFDTIPGEYADLVVVAEAAISWARALKAAAYAVDSSHEYRISLVAAAPGSSHWIAKVEQSRINQFAKRVQTGWTSMPLVVRLGVGLAAAIPATIVPTYRMYFDDPGFSERQKAELRDIVEKASHDPQVQDHREQMYSEAARDSKITGIGTGVPTSIDWKPPALVPSSRFAEASGLFKSPLEADALEKTIVSEIDVVLITPRLENAKKAWTFRQEGIGDFNAEMADPDFLAALERKDGVPENLRANIPMRIRLEVRMQKGDGDWTVVRRGRRVTKVLYPSVD